MWKMFQIMLVRRLVVVRRQLARRSLCTAVSNPGSGEYLASAAEDLYKFCGNFPAERRAGFMASFRLQLDFVSRAEEEPFVSEMEPHLTRHKYERDHWDNVSDFKSMRLILLQKLRESQRNLFCYIQNYTGTYSYY